LRFCCLTALARKNITLINPYFDANQTKSRMRLCLPVIDVGTQSMQRNLSLDLFLAPSNFRSTQPPANKYLDAFRVAFYCLLHCLFHSAPERNTLLQLLRNRACYQVGIQFWSTNFKNIQAYTLPRLRLQSSTQVINFLPVLSDHDPRFCGMNCDRYLVRSSTLNLNFRNCCVCQLFMDTIADHQVFGEQVFIVTLSVPARLPVFNDAEPEADGMDFMSQICPPSLITGLRPG
jgi:hypothetical protein